MSLGSMRPAPLPLCSRLVCATLPGPVLDLIDETNSRHEQAKGYLGGITVSLVRTWPGVTSYNADADAMAHISNSGSEQKLGADVVRMSNAKNAAHMPPPHMLVKDHSTSKLFPHMSSREAGLMRSDTYVPVGMGAVAIAWTACAH